MTIIKRPGQAEGVIEFGYIGKAVVGVIVVGIPALIAFHISLEHRMTHLEDAQLRMEAAQTALLQAAQRGEDQRDEIKGLIDSVRNDVAVNSLRIHELEAWRERMRDAGKAPR